MLEQQLEKLGLHKNEVKVYLALFELGKAKAGEIIDSTKLHRNLVYTALEDLAAKNLISKMERGKVAVFEINDPKILQELVEEKMDTAKDVVEELQNRLHTKPRDVRVYEGESGVVATREQVAREILPGEKYYVMGVSYSQSNPELNSYFRKFNKKVIDKGADIKVLAVGSEDVDVVIDRGLTWGEHARSLPFSVDSPMWMTLFRDTMNISLVGQDPITFSIRSQEAADGFKKYFEYFWNQKVKTETGLDAFKKIIYEMLGELKPGEEYFVLGASAGDETGGVQELYDKFHQDRIKKGVITKMLVYRDSLKRIKERFDKCGDAAYKVSLVKTYSTAPGIPMQINMYNGKAFVILYGAEPTIIRFENSEIHDGFKTYFNELWSQETVTTEGFDAFTESWTELFDRLKPGETYRIFGAGFGSGDNQKKYTDFFRELHKKRIARGVKGQLLFHRGAEDVVHKYRMDELYVKGQEFKTLPFNSEFPVEVFFHDDTTLLLIQKKEPTLIKIKNKDVAKSFQNYLDEFWNQETQVLYGAETLRNLWLEAVDCKELRFIGARGYFIDNYPEMFEEIKEKAARTPGVKWKNIIDSSLSGHELTKLPWVETRYNLSSTKNPNATWLFGDKVLIVNWTKKEPVIFCSTNPTLVQSYSDYFDELWGKK